MDSIGDQFLSRQRVLVIAPHADDETYGCAGTIARIKDLGGRVYVCLISVGSLEHYAGNADGSAMRRVTSGTRLREFSDVMKLLKVDDWASLCATYREHRGSPMARGHTDNAESHHGCRRRPAHSVGRRGHGHRAAIELTVRSVRPRGYPPAANAAGTSRSEWRCGSPTERV